MKAPVFAVVSLVTVVNALAPALPTAAQVSAKRLDPDPDKAGALAATGAFAFGCLERLSFAATAEAYAAGTETLAAQIKSQPEMAPLPFTIESVNGDTCRVTYHGAQTAVLWTALSDFGRNRANAPCTDGLATASQVSITCAATKTSPAYQVRIERDGDRFIASITWKGPGLP